jgi:DNA-binding IclR family transcriptional regulator
LAAETPSLPGDKTGPEEKDPQFAYTLARGLQVMRAFEGSDLWVGNRELATRTGIPRPTVARLTRTLAMLGYLRYDPKQSRYRLAPSTLSLGHPLLAHLTIRQLARPLMQQLADFAHGGVSLGMRDNLHMVLIESCVDVHAITARPDIGVTRVITQTAMGRAFLAQLETPERTRLLDEISRTAPEQWGVHGAQVLEEIERFQSWGYCIARDTSRKGIHAVAAPIAGSHGLDAIVVNCAVASFQLRGDALEEDIAPRLLSLAHSVQASQGGR